MKSFRVRIILWTIGIAGLVMLGFGVAGNLAYERVKRKQIDEGLILFGERPVPPPGHARYWDRAGPESMRELARRFGAECVLAVYGREEVDATLLKGEEEASYEMDSWGEFGLLYPDRSELPQVDGFFEPFEGFGRGGMLRSGGLPGGFGGRDRNPRPDVLLPRVSLSTKVGLDTGDHWRIALVRFDGYNLLLGVNLEQARKDSALMRRTFAIAFPIALGLMGIGIWFFVTRAISPVKRLTQSIESVSAKSLGARLEIDGEYEEFTGLIEHFNGMLERLDRSFSQATRFSADAAHELKTPLAILQGQLEVALQEAEDGSETQRLLGGLLEETLRLKSITRKLLVLAKADAGSLEALRERVDLRRLVEEEIELVRDDAPGVELALVAEGERFEAFCDETLSRQILKNLIGNALKYRRPADAGIEVSLRSGEVGIVLEVFNPCEEIGEAARERLFDRFVRGSAARNRAEDGAGLGLSLSLEFAKAQGGFLSMVKETALDEMRIRLVLPRGGTVAGVD